jgi:hypothetical protein
MLDHKIKILEFLIGALISLLNFLFTILLSLQCMDYLLACILSHFVTKVYFSEEPKTHIQVSSNIFL